MRDYHINIFYSDDDEEYIADIPDLEACSAFGGTPDEALHEVQKAKDLWIKAARAEGKPVPPPNYISGDFSLSIFQRRYRGRYVGTLVMLVLGTPHLFPV